jgi:cell wall assembly regulator SMI1
MVSLSSMPQLKRKTTIFRLRNPKKSKTDQLRQEEDKIKKLRAKIEEIKDHLSSVVEKCEPDEKLIFYQGTTDRRLASWQRIVLYNNYKLPIEFLELYQKYDGCSEDLFFTPLKIIEEQYYSWLEIANDDPTENEHKNKDRRVNQTKWFHPGWIPISTNNGDHIIMDLAPTSRGKIGQIFVFSHEIGFVRYLADNIFDYLLQIEQIEHY